MHSRALVVLSGRDPFRIQVAADQRACAPLLAASFVKSPKSSEGCNRMTRTSELLFVDPSISDVAVILKGLRPQVEAIVLDRRRPAARQLDEGMLVGRRHGADKLASLHPWSIEHLDAADRV